MSERFFVTLPRKFIKAWPTCHVRQGTINAAVTWEFTNITTGFPEYMWGGVLSC